MLHENIRMENHFTVKASFISTLEQPRLVCSVSTPLFALIRLCNSVVFNLMSALTTLCFLISAFTPVRSCLLERFEGFLCVCRVIKGVVSAIPQNYGQDRRAERGSIRCGSSEMAFTGKRISLSKHPARRSVFSRFSQWPRLRCLLLPARSE